MRHRRSPEEQPWRTAVLSVVVLAAVVACLYVVAGIDHSRGQGAASPGGRGTAAPTGEVLEDGRGTFTRATGNSAVSGDGKPLRYTVDVEDGTGQDPQAFAREVDRIL